MFFNVFVLYLCIVPIINQFLVFFDIGRIIFFEYSIKSFYLVLLYAIVFFIISFIFVPSIIRTFTKVAYIDEIQQTSHKNTFYTILFCGGLSITASLIFFALVGAIPMLHPDVSTFRSTAKAGKGEIVLIANSFAAISSVLSGLVYSSVDRLRKMTLVVVLFFVFVCQLGFGFRAPAFFLLLAFLISVTFKNNRPRPIQLKLVMGLLLLLFVAVLVGTWRDSDDNAKSVSFLIPLYWTLSVNFFNFDNVLSYFDNPMNSYYYGSTFINDISVMLPGTEAKFLGVLLKELLELKFDGEGMTVTAPGEGYVNFGFFGLVIHAVIVAGTLSSIHYLCIRKRSIIFKFIRIFFVIYSPVLVTGGISPFVIFNVLPMVIVLIGLFVLKSVLPRNAIKR